MTAKVEWFGDRVLQNIRIGMTARLRLAAQLVRDRVVINISRPVTKTKGVRSGRIVSSNRSRPGEFPKADTTRLMKDIFFEVSGHEARVGTTLDYGLVLETSMNRSFLRRSFIQMQPTITRVLTQGRGGGTEFRGQE